MNGTVNLLKWRKDILKNSEYKLKPSVKNKERLYLLEEETRNSIMIEGYFANKAEIQRTIQTKKYSENSQAILGYFDAASLIYEFAYQKYTNHENIVIQQSDIKTIHSLMFRGQDRVKQGTYRSSEITIQSTKINPPLGNLVSENIDYMINFVNGLKFDEENIINSLSKFHTLFESIHPFEDGNGRVGRVLINYILLSYGYPNIIIKGTNSEKEKYFLGLEESEVGLYDYFPEIIPDDNRTYKGNFKKLENLLLSNLFESMDYLILSLYSDNELISLNDIMKENGFSIDYGRKLVNRGKIIAKKIGNTRHTHKDLLMI